jgi:hypothetical protein
MYVISGYHYNRFSALNHPLQVFRHDRSCGGLEVTLSFHWDPSPVFINPCFSSNSPLLEREFHQSVVEQSRTLLDKCDAEILRSVEHGAIVLRARWGGNVFHPASCCAIDVVDKGEL